MGSISSTGLISGLDTDSIVSQLIALEARPRDKVEEHVAILNSQKAAFLDVNARLLALKTSASSFLDSSVFGSFKATSSNDNVLSATASSSASPGTYSLTVDKLVTNHQLITKGFVDSDTSAIGAGTMTFESAAGKLSKTTSLSELNGAAGVKRGVIRITDRSGNSADIDLSKAVTVENVLDAINSAGNINITASITGDELTLTDNTGQTTSNVIVQSLGGAQTAEDLGLAGNSDGTNTITGSQINTLSQNSALKLLNDGNGVRSQVGTDLTINDHAGNAIAVDISSATTVGHVIDLINTAALAAGSTVTAGIGDDGVSIKLVESTAFSGNELSVDASDTTTDLGLVISDFDHDGTLDGDRLIATMGSKLLKNLNGGAGIGMGMALGPSVLTPSTPLADLFDGAGLTVDVNFADITITAKDNQFVSYEVDIDALTTVQDLIDEFNTQTGGKVTLAIEGRALRVTDNTGGANNLRIRGVFSSSVAAEELGIEVNTTASTVLGVDTQPTPPVLDGFGPSPIRITNSLGATNDIDLTTARSVDDVLKAINNAGIGITATLNIAGNGITLTDTNNGGNDLIIADISSGTTAADLGIAGTFTDATAESGDLDVQYISVNTRLEDINNGQGVQRGKFILTDSNGVTGTVDLTQGDEVTISDVIAEINSRPTEITATINATGDGILLTDNAGGALKMKVTEDGGRIARDLGILGEDEDGDGILNGSFEKTIEIESDDTLEDIADKINSADFGVSVTLINDGSAMPYRLNITSQTSGTAGEMLFDDGGLGLAATTLVKASDAVVFFGSSDPAQAILLTSSTNSLKDTIEGVTIDLAGVSDEAVTLSITKDFDKVVDEIGTFTERYNSVIDRIHDLDSYNSDSEERGLLLGDRTLATVKRMMYRLINQRYEDVDSQYQYLTQVGLKVGSGAKLQFDEAQFREALATDEDAVASLFTLKTTGETADIEISPGITIPGGSLTVETMGMGASLEQMIEALTDSLDGRLSVTTNNLDKQIKLSTQRIESLNKSLEAKKQRLYNDFKNMELALAQVQNQSAALQTLKFLLPSNNKN